MKKVLVVVMCLVLAAAMFVGCTAAPAASETPAASESAAASESVAPSESASEPVGSDESGAEAETTTNDLKKIVPEGDLVVGVSTGSSGTSWRDMMIANMTTVLDEYKAAGRIKDYKFQNNTTNGDANEQAQILRNFVDDPEVNVILVNPNDNTALTEVIADAQNAGKLVVVFDATADAPGTLQVSNNHYAGDMKAQEWIASKVQKGNAIEIYGLDGHPANTPRMQVVQDVVADYPDIKLIQSTPGSWDQTKAKEAAAQIISGGQDIDIVFTQDGMSYGILQAFQDAGKLPKAMTADPGTAFFKEWKKLIDDGVEFYAACSPNPPGIGATAVGLAINLAEGKEFKDALEDGKVYRYNTTLFFNNDNFEEGWELLKDQPDDYLLTEYLTMEQADALFK